MTEEDFYYKLHLKYQEANKLMEGTGGYSIRRGMAHNVSGYAEDLFALFIAEKLDSQGVLFYVDKVVSIRLNGNARATSFKPDLMIIKENVITHYFDLKMNLGWNRNVKLYLEQKNNFISRIRGEKAWIRYENREVNPFEVSVDEVIIAEDIKYQMLVLFGGNINEKQMNENSSVAANLDCVTFDVLRDKINKENGWQINHQAFNRIYKSIEKLK